MTRHLSLRLLAALMLLGLPSPGAAADRSRPPPANPASPSPPSPPAPAATRPPPPDGASPSARPPPPDGSGQPRPPPPGTRPVYPPGYAPPPPYWYGWGWGWGYAPLWGYGWWGAPPPPPEASAPLPGPPADRLVSTLRATYMDGEGSGGSLAFASEGRQLGWRFSVDGLTPDRIDGAQRLPGSDPMAYGFAAVTWSLAAAETHRLRLEGGGSMLAMPSTGSYQGAPYAGTTAFGLLLGLSGQVGLVGPLGLEGHVRTTPYPVLIVDAGLAAALRFGPVAFTGGWRWLEISGSSGNGPTASISAPELGLAVVF